MRILLINHSYFGGGAERCVRELHQGLLRRGHDVEVWIANTSGRLPSGVKQISYFWEKNLIAFDLAANMTDWRHLGSIHALKKVTSAHFDIIHIHSISGGWISLSALSRACKRVPSVWTIHDEWAVTNGFICDLTDKFPKKEVLDRTRGLGKVLGRSPYHDNFKNRRVGKLLDRAIPRPSLLIAPSQHIQKLIDNCERFRSSKSIHAYHGLSMLDEKAKSMSRIDARRYWKIDPAAPVILMVAANLHDAHKGIWLGLDAINRVGSKISPHIFLLGKHAEKLVELLPKGRCTLGFASNNEQLAIAYRSADMTLIPSLGEALSFVALESLVCQTPVVAFGVGGLVEIVGNNERGLLATPFDTKMMSEHLGVLCCDMDRRTHLGIQGCRWVEENCGMSAYIDKMERCYHDAITSF